MDDREEEEGSRGGSREENGEREAGREGKGGRGGEEEGEGGQRGKTGAACQVGTIFTEDAEYFFLLIILMNFHFSGFGITKRQKLRTKDKTRWRSKEGTLPDRN